jgi:menaquinone-dependent protoporphyrinogen oxidase
VLVTYATRNGSTAEVAQAIATRLRDRGALVDLKVASEVRDASGYEALVVGAPIYAGRWLAGAHRVVKRAAKLPPERRPAVAIFALGPRTDDGPENWLRPREQFERALGKHPSASPISTALFGGADPPRMSPRRDIRNWAAIDEWAEAIALLLGVRDASA